MGTAAQIIGVIGGLLGVLLAATGLFLGRAAGAPLVVGANWYAFLFSLLGVLGGGVASRKARLGGALEELTAPETVTPPAGMRYVPLWGLSFVRLVDHLAAVALDGAPVEPAATFQDGLAVQRVLDGVRDAARRGWVRV